MRIIGGAWRGRAIGAPSGRLVRPTADRVREAWMSILQHDLPGSRVLDLFAGSGALGLEALSRGAASVTFVEAHPASLRALGANIEALGAQGAAVVHRGDALRFAAALPAGAFDVAFADPPYRQELAARLVARWQAVPFAAVLSVEHAATEIFPAPGDTRRYGSTAITFYRAA